MLKTFKYRLYPSPHQIRLLEQTLETCRRWYNTCLAERKDAWEKEHRSIGQYAQLAQVKEFRRTNPFAAQVHSHILQVTTVDVDQAFQSTGQSVTKDREICVPLEFWVKRGRCIRAAA